jgi:hypothetical protein
MPKVPRSTWRATQPCRTPSVGQMRTFSGTSSSLQLSVTLSSTSWRAHTSCKLFLSTQNCTAQLNDVDRQQDACTSCSTALVLVITLVLTGSNVSSLCCCLLDNYRLHNAAIRCSQHLPSNPLTHSVLRSLIQDLTLTRPSIHPSIHACVYN